MKTKNLLSIFWGIMAGILATSSLYAGASYPNGPPSSGYNLFSPINSKNTYLMDNDESIIKTWTSNYRPGQSVYLLDDGTLMRTANTGSTTFSEGGTAGRVEQYDWDGNLIWAYDYDTSSHRSHHDIEVLPNGHILMIAWELKSQSEAVAAGRDPSLLTDGELWPDHIIEVAPTGSYGGTIVWEWHVWDHLVQDYSSSQANYGTVADHPEKIDLNYTQSGPIGGGADWNHINAVDYNAERDQILLSVHNFSEIWVIDHNTTTAEAAGSAGDLLYRWGNPAAYDSGDSTDQQLFAQHDAHWIESGLPGAGNILIFNNGQGRSDGNYSSVDEIVPPVASDGTYTNGLPLAPVWSYTNSVATDFYASRISGAQRLPNGNTLICEGTEYYAFEVTSNGDLVWSYTGTGEMFRFERYAPDFAGFSNTELALPTTTYPIVDTAQDVFCDNSTEISEPGPNDAFYGQDACYDGNQPKYEISPDGLTVYDYNTGLTWTRSHDWNGDGTLNSDDKKTQANAVTYAATLNAENYGGYSDWRLPSTKEIYSLMDFRGTDPNVMSDDTSGLTPFIDTTYFKIGYGDTDAGERVIDSQFATTTIYVNTVMYGQEAMFGLNLVDGRIKGYPTQTGKTYYAYYCRGNTAYGTNNFTDNGDGTVTDSATGLMWAQADDGNGMDWSSALAYAEASELAGYTDWRLPNTKELQSIVDYTRSPGTTASAAIDPVFSATQITNMAGEADYPWYWTGTTHLKFSGNCDSGSYVCFGRGTGTMDGGDTIIDVHGAGCQRSDPKTGDAADYPSSGHGPQGDVQRVFNFVRLVRTVTTTGTSTTTTDTSAPTSPTNLSGTASSATAVDLTWTASTDNIGVTGYKVYRGSTQIGTSASPSYTDSGLTAGTTYSYSVAAYDASDNTSAPCMAVSVTTRSAATYTVTNVNTLSDALTAAAAKPSEETTITLAAGTYTLTDDLPTISSSDLTIAGPAGTTNTAIIDGAGTPSGVIFKISGSGVTISSLQLNNATTHAITIESTSQSGLISDCGFYQTDDASATGAAIEGVGCVNWVVTGNSINGIAGDNATAEPAIHFHTGASNTVITNNLLLNCDRGIGLGSGASSTHSGGTIRNNMISDVRTAGFPGPGISLESTADACVDNNTVYQAGSYANAIEYNYPGTTGAVIRNNLVSRAITPLNSPGAATLAANNTSAMASWFTAPADGDLHLASSVSGVVDAGTTIADLTTDIDGDTRPTNSVYDIGADEYTGSATDTTDSSSSDSGSSNTSSSDSTSTSSSSGGGGGAPSTWFLATLLILGVARRFFTSRQQSLAG